MPCRCCTVSFPDFNLPGFWLSCHSFLSPPTLRSQTNSPLVFYSRLFQSQLIFGRAGPLLLPWVSPEIAAAGAAPVAVSGLLTVLSSFAGCRLRVHGLSLWWCVGSVVVAYRLSCRMACRILLDQGLNLCLLIGRWISATEPEAL